VAAWKLVYIRLTMQNRFIWEGGPKCATVWHYFQTITKPEGSKCGKYLTLTLQSGAQSMFVTLPTFSGIEQQSILQHTLCLLFYNVQSFRYTQGLYRQKCWLPNYWGRDTSLAVPHLTVLSKGDLGDIFVRWIPEEANTPNVGSTCISMDRNKYLTTEYYYKSPSW
jgi:hypothetical protein